MSNNDLTKAEARALITPVIDNEVNASQRDAFIDYIAQHDDVRREYESLQKVKILMASRCPSAKAPSSLKQFVKSICRDHSNTKEPGAPIYDVACKQTVSQQTDSAQPDAPSTSHRRPWIFSIAASLLVIAAVWGFFSFYSTSDTTVYNVEEYAYKYFKKHNGQFVPPTISTASLGSAEIQMARNYDIKLTIPALENAEFKGVMYADFVPNYKAPMLEYYLPSEDQYIYIFAFELDKMKEFGQLIRDQEAIKKCNKPKDFYIRNVNGKHVVSWKWNDVWYAAISNHDGNTLASLVKPLQYNSSED